MNFKISRGLSFAVRNPDKGRHAFLDRVTTTCQSFELVRNFIPRQSGNTSS